MQNSSYVTQQQKPEGIFFYLLLLTSFFFFIEISFFIECNKVYLSDFTFVANNIHLPLSILPGIIYFFLAQLFLHALYCIFIGLLTQLIVNLFPQLETKKIFLAIVIWLLGIITIFVANQYFYPNSKFAELTSIVLFNPVITQFIFIFLCSIFFILFFLVTIAILQIMVRKPLYRMLFAILVIIGGGFYFKPAMKIPSNPATASRPNILLIGVDSLRPDFLSFFSDRNSTPFLDSFLMNASVFNEAVTPLARTFPSWTSILTGEYPRQTGIRSNLAQQNQVDLSHTLAAILQHQGYETIFATDETRFSNIDKNYGFDKVITPPMGLNDFLLGTFNDFPLSNLFLNTPIGKWLFPYTYANRPVYFAYNPNSFLKLIQPHLATQKSKPLFLTIHFCLPHYPYLWADLPGNNYSVQERYVASIQRVDKQLNDFFNLLRNSHLLDHAIVVLLSDHGEALALFGDRITDKDSFISSHSTPVPQFYPPGPDQEAINQSYGHGTDVLGLPQYHSLLAFKLYGIEPQQGKIIPGIVSLLDIKPTILDLLQLTKPTGMGISLKQFMQQNDQAVPLQHIFLESDFTPEAIRTVYPETEKVLLEGIKIFQVDAKTTRLTVKASMNNMIIKSKQYADLYGEWMLALYPQNSYFRMPILVNLKSGQWTNDLRTPFAQHSPALTMLAALKTFYGEEINKF